MTLWVITCFTYFSMYNPIKPFFLSLGGTQPWATYEHWILQRINPALVPWTPSFICCGDPVSFLVWLKGPNLCYGLQYLYIQYTYTHSIYIYTYIYYTYLTFIIMILWVVTFITAFQKMHGPLKLVTHFEGCACVVFLTQKKVALKIDGYDALKKYR